MRLLAAVRAELPGLQAEAEALMTETCRVDRVLSVDSDDMGRPIVVLADPPIYEGPVKIQSFRPYPQEREVVGSTSVAQMYDLHVPAPARIAALATTWNGPIKNGDFMTRTTPGRAEEVYRVETEHDKTWQTAQRLVGQLQTGGITA